MIFHWNEGMVKGKSRKNAFENQGEKFLRGVINALGGRE